MANLEFGCNQITQHRGSDIWNCRLYAKGRILGHKRGKRNTRPNTSLLQVEGVATKDDTKFYLGKVMYRIGTYLCGKLKYLMLCFVSLAGCLCLSCKDTGPGVASTCHLGVRRLIGGFKIVPLI